MCLLAEMPLPVYLTTCQHGFLEVELANTYSKNPVPEIFYWDDSIVQIASARRGIPSQFPRNGRCRAMQAPGNHAYVTAAGAQ